MFAFILRRFFQAVTVMVAQAATALLFRLRVGTAGGHRC
jgi:hypothetical protein